MKIANRILYLGKIPLIEKHYQRQLTVSASLVHAKNIRGCTLDVIALVKSQKKRWDTPATSGVKILWLNNSFGNCVLTSVNYKTIFFSGIHELMLFCLGNLVFCRFLWEALNLTAAESGNAHKMADRRFGQSSPIYAARSVCDELLHSSDGERWTRWTPKLIISMIALG